MANEVNPLSVNSVLCRDDSPTEIIATKTTTDTKRVNIQDVRQAGLSSAPTLFATYLYAAFSNDLS